MITKHAANELLLLIQQYSTIIIHTHSKPDLDALGSQVGLLEYIQYNYPEKTVVAVGEVNHHEEFTDSLSIVPDTLYSNALAIVTDTAAKALLADKRCLEAECLIVIDHHLSRGPFGQIKILDTSAISACQMLVDMMRQWDLAMNISIATKLMMGLIADSGRFRYQGVGQGTFAAAAYLMQYNVDLDAIYQEMYKQRIDFTRYRGYVMQNFIIDRQLAYMKNTADDVNHSGLSTFDVSRGMVSAMADLEGIEIWANFTECDEGIYAELRSKSIPVNEIAAAFGGGGHRLASGATLQDWAHADKMIQELIDRIER